VQREWQGRGAVHVNLLVKGVPGRDAEALREVLSERWCARVDAEPKGQWAEAVETAAHVVKYVTAPVKHGMKSSQAPPYGWKGHRLSATRGYFCAPMPEIREEARRRLRLSAELWRRMQELRAEDERVGGLPPEYFNDQADAIYREARAAVEQSEQTTWTFQTLLPVTLSPAV
jgi:hypothetical protein